MRMLRFFLNRLGLPALLLVLLSACTVVVDEPVEVPVDSGPRLCSREYAPVCASRGGDRQTFSNGCLAERAGYRIVRNGECRRDAPPSRRDLCTREYAPVCARRGGDRRTFSNGCLAEEAGYRITSDGECRRERPDDDGPSICTREYRPVCARRGSEVRTFGNECEARSADYRIISDGSC